MGTLHLVAIILLMCQGGAVTWALNSSNFSNHIKILPGYTDSVVTIFHKTVINENSCTIRITRFFTNSPTILPLNLLIIQISHELL